MDEGVPTLPHQAVLIREAAEGLNLEPGDTILDATVGGAGHALEVLPRILPGGRLIGIDQDSMAIELARQALRNFKNSAILVNSNFRNLDKVLKDLGIDRIGGALFDLGISSYQLEDASRGFGIKVESRLDMRMDTRSHLSAFDVVNRMSERELADIIFKFGEEPFARRIARAIAQERARHPISSTKELARITAGAIRIRRRRQKIHPATRTFQAIRIYVNDELGALEEGLEKAIGHLDPSARVVVISFHSLEDRIVKETFKKMQEQGILKTITKKPVTPSRAEILLNPRSRSAKLRVAEKVAAV